MTQQARRLDLSLAGVAATDDNARALSLPFVAGQQVDVEFTASPQTKQISTRLGRKPLGWLVTRVRGGVSALYETASDASTLTLVHTGGAAVSVSLWVY